VYQSQREKAVSQIIKFTIHLTKRDSLMSKCDSLTIHFAHLRLSHFHVRLSHLISGAESAYSNSGLMAQLQISLRHHESGATGCESAEMYQSQAEMYQSRWSLIHFESDTFSFSVDL
jgi:hypothetical protein